MYNETYDMVAKDNWLKVAIAAETQGQEPNVGGNAISENKAYQSAETPAINPKPTPTTEQQARTTQRQRAEIGKTLEVSLPDVARQALPALNQSLHILTTELSSRGDLNITPNIARALAVEIMAEWLAASRKSVVSDLASIVAKSSRIQSVVSSMS